jgi:hypothetical protein
VIIGSAESVSAAPGGRALLYGDRAYCAAVTLPRPVRARVQAGVAG